MPRQFRLSLQRPASFRREDLVLSAANAAAVRAVESWPAWHGGALALVGPAATGKSHLAFAWADAAQAVALTADCRMQDLEEVRGRPVLADDAEAFPDETLFHLINMAGESGGGLLLTARRAPSLWSADLPDLRSRLNAIQVAELAEPDDEMLEGVMRKFFRERNIRPPEELLSYLIRRIERSVPAAREVVSRLDDAADAAGRPVSRTLAREILEAGEDSGDLFEDSLVGAAGMGEKPDP